MRACPAKAAGGNRVRGKLSERPGVSNGPIWTYGHAVRLGQVATSAPPCGTAGAARAKSGQNDQTQVRPVSLTIMRCATTQGRLRREWPRREGAREGRGWVRALCAQSWTECTVLDEASIRRRRRARPEADGGGAWAPPRYSMPGHGLVDRGGRRFGAVCGRPCAHGGCDG